MNRILGSLLTKVVYFPLIGIYSKRTGSMDEEGPMGLRTDEEVDLEPLLGENGLELLESALSTELIEGPGAPEVSPAAIVSTIPDDIPSIFIHTSLLTIILLALFRRCRWHIHHRPPHPPHPRCHVSQWSWKKPTSLQFHGRCRHPQA